MMLDGSAQSLAIATSGGIQCETINVAPCKQRMLYNLTTMPNFFDDLTQAEAHTRAKQYNSLLDSTCNQFMSTYLCQLITPVCLDQDLEAMYKFKIYPCRTFCRRMLTDCGAEIDAHRRLLATHLLADPGGFDCDRLPYEANGGNLSSALYGPCHDPFMDEQQQQQQQPDSKSPQNQFRPFEREKDIFIAETSPLDIFSHIQPSAGASNSNHNNHNHKQSKTATSTVAPPVGAPTPNQPTPNQHQQQQQPSWWHQIGLAGQSVITNLVKYSNVISIFTVLVLLAALNVKRLRRLERFYASTSSASSSSSSSACSSAPLNAGGGGSLAKGASSKSAAIASLSGGSSIAATTTNAGYHSALARQQQIYTNILLSSPSHQVLLLNDSSAQTGARSKLLGRGELLPSPAHHHHNQSKQLVGQAKHSRAPQTRAPPLPPPPPLFESSPAASNYNYLSGSDQHSSSGYYEPEPVGGGGAARHSPYASSSMSPATSAATYDAPHSHLSAAGDSLRRSSFRRHQQHPLKACATPTKPPTAQQQQHPNLGLFMGP